MFIMFSVCVAQFAPSLDCVPHSRTESTDPSDAAVGSVPTNVNTWPCFDKHIPGRAHKGYHCLAHRAEDNF